MLKRPTLFLDQIAFELRELSGIDVGRGGGRYHLKTPLRVLEMDNLDPLGNAEGFWEDRFLSAKAAYDVTRAAEAQAPKPCVVLRLASGEKRTIEGEPAVLLSRFRRSEACEFSPAEVNPLKDFLQRVRWPGDGHNLWNLAAGVTIIEAENITPPPPATAA